MPEPSDSWAPRDDDTETCDACGTETPIVDLRATADGYHCITCDEEGI